MKAAARCFLGEHDFASFCAAGSQAETTVRRIVLTEVTEDGPFLRFRVSGTGFLYNMVRIMAGTLLKTGFGQLSPEQIPQILEAKDRKEAGPTAPPQGLCLIGIDLYPDGFPAGLRQNGGGA